MQVEHGLASSRTIVDDEAEGVLHTKLFGDPACDQQQMAQQRLVALIGID